MGDWSDIPMKVLPRQLRRYTGKGGVVKYAAMMPYPSLDGTQGCAGKADLFDEADDSKSGARLEAREICDACHFAVACREWAIAHEDSGYWGGTTAAMRRTIRKRRRQALVTPHLGERFGFNTTFFPEIRTDAQAGAVVDRERDDWGRFVSSDDLWRMNGPE